VVGSRLPAHATSMGKVLLAYQPLRQLDAYLAKNPLRALTARTVTNVIEFRNLIARVREQGWAITDGELEEGVRSVAAPIFDGAREAAAAINISVHPARVSVSELKRVHLPILLETAEKISSGLQTFRPASTDVKPAAPPRRTRTRTAKAARVRS